MFGDFIWLNYHSRTVVYLLICLTTCKSLIKDKKIGNKVRIVECVSLSVMSNSLPYGLLPSRLLSKFLRPNILLKGIIITSSKIFNKNKMFLVFSIQKCIPFFHIHLLNTIHCSTGKFQTLCVPACVLV